MHVELPPILPVIPNACQILRINVIRIMCGTSHRKSRNLQTGSQSGNNPFAHRKIKRRSQTLSEGRLAVVFAKIHLSTGSYGNKPVVPKTISNKPLPWSFAINALVIFLLVLSHRHQRQHGNQTNQQNLSHRTIIFKSHSQRLD